MLIDDGIAQEKPRPYFHCGPWRGVGNQNRKILTLRFWTIYYTSPKLYFLLISLK